MVRLSNHDRVFQRPARRLQARVLVLAASCLGGAASCGSGRPAGEPLLVSAAISLKEPFEEIARGWERRHPGARVALNFGASGDLARQVEAGAPVDVLAAADERSMERLVARRLVSAPRPIARNRLVLVARRGRLPGLRFTTLSTDARITRFAVGSPETVPAGRYAVDVLTAVGALPAIAGRLVYAGNVRQVLDYVARGEADAGVVYATDLRAAPAAVEEVDSAPADRAPAIRYPIAVVTSSSRSAAAREFVDAVAGPEGQAALAARGFLPP